MSAPSVGTSCRSSAMPTPRPGTGPWVLTLAAFALVLGLSGEVGAQNAIDTDALDLSELSLEQLMGIQVQVTSVAKKPQDPFRTPAAVYVLSSEDIRRSGVTSLAEALRLVPGVHVARSDSSLYDVGIRGFNAGHSNKTLVLIDGRSVYSPLFAGTFWEIQDTMIEDVDRIEVIRGPGASVWGANAVNGVINVITKSAGDTQGTLASVQVGTNERVLSVRHGGTFDDESENGAWRAYAKARDVDASKDIFGPGYNQDDWWHRRAGFRTDWDPELDEQITVQGDVYDGRQTYGSRWTDHINGDFPIEVTSRQHGGNVLGRWMHQPADDETLTVQTYYDRTERTNEFYTEDRDTLDIEFTHHIEASDTHDVVWGAGWRGSEGRTTGTTNFRFTPRRKKLTISNLYVQDEITIVPDEFSITLGSKFEHNTYTGWELQPTGRFTWTPDDDQTIWGAVSRAVRTPSPVERDGFIAALGLPDDGVQGFDGLVAFVPGKDMQSEKLTAYELGWRARTDDDITVDLAAFYHDYRKLGTDEWTTPTLYPPTTVLFPLEAMNTMEGYVRGAELAVEWNATDDWSLTTGYTYLDVYFNAHNASTALNLKDNEKNEPQGVFLLRSYHDLDEQWELDWMLFHVDELVGTGVPSYWKGDVRLGYRPDEQTEISLGVVNLFHDGGQESAQAAVEAAAYLRATRRF